MSNTTIQIKRSSSNASPVSLNPGELAYSFVSGNLFIGNTTNTPIMIGGANIVSRVYSIFDGTANLNVSSITTNYTQLNKLPYTQSPAYSEGLLWYNSNAHNIQFQTDFSDFDSIPGQIEYIRVYNNTGSQINKGRAVYSTGVKGVSNPIDSRILTIDLADASDIHKKNCIGLAGHNIPAGSEGFVQCRGPIYGINTSTLTAGSRVHLGFDNPGDIVDNAPEYPYFPMDLGECLVSNSTTGCIYVDIIDHAFERIYVENNARIAGDLVVDGNFVVYGTPTILTNTGVGSQYFYLGSGDSILNPSFSGTGVDDVSFVGHYEGDPASTSYYVRINVGGNSQLNTFDWSFNNTFSPLQGSNIAITGGRQSLANGISVQFQNQYYHVAGDTWSGTAYAKNEDFGIVGNYNDGTYTHSGLFRDASDSEFKFFNKYTPEPSGNIDISNASFQFANVRAEKYVANSFYIGTTNVATYIANSANTVRVSANSGSTLSNKQLNFINTSSVTVTVSDAGNGNANISFVSSSSGGTVTSVGTGLGLTGGPISTTGTISANLASTTVQGISKLVDVINSTDTANAATANSVKTSYDQATNAYGQANSAYTQANNSYGQANNAYGQANNAYTAANSSANTVAVYANGSLILSKSNLNFNNTSSVTIVAAANGTTQTNIGFTVPVSTTSVVGITKLVDAVNSTDSANAATANAAKTAYDQATNAYGQANSAYTQANSSYGQANNAYGQANNAYGQANNSYSQANSAYTQANNAYTAANSAANTVRVSANSGSTLSNKQLNFINTSTVSVTVTDSGAGNANIAFTSTGSGLTTFPVSANSGSTQTSNGINFVNTASVTVTVTAGVGGNANVSFQSISGGSGTVTSVGTGIGLTGGPITSAGTISANIASTTVQGVTKLVDAINSTDTANAATANSVKTAYDQANNAYTQANNAYTQANNAYGQANNAYTQANNAYTQANNAYTQANNAYGQANSGYTQANNAYGQANSAYTAANTSANTVAVHANGSLILAKGNLNFNNTSSVNVSAVANGTTQTNIAFSVATATTSVIGITKLVDAINSTDTANAATANAAKTAYDQATNAYGQANNAYGQANSAYTQANNAYGQANSAYTQANNAYGQANNAYAQANSSANTVAVFANGSIILPKSNINFNNTSSVTVVASANGTTQTNIAFTVPVSTTTVVGITKLIDGISSTDTANAATANSAKTAYDQATNAYGQANSAYTQANNAYGQANTAYTQANNAYLAANTSGNTVSVSANSGTPLVNKKLNFVNTATVTVSVIDAGSGNANISFTAIGGGSGSGNANIVGGNTQVFFNNNGIMGASQNFTYNSAPNLVSVDASLRVANNNNLYFGGSQANTVANSKFAISYNASATSLDFTFLG